MRRFARNIGGCKGTHGDQALPSLCIQRHAGKFVYIVSEDVKLSVRQALPQKFQVGQRQYHPRKRMDLLRSFLLKFRFDPPANAGGTDLTAMRSPLLRQSPSGTNFFTETGRLKVQ
jgi:hypothetical protein